MNTLVHQRKATMFRLDIELLERLKELAKKERFSVVFLNIGMGLYCLYWTGQIVLQLLQ